eukprot:5457723-Prymnesium_polylepis.3
MLNAPADTVTLVMPAPSDGTVLTQPRSPSECNEHCGCVTRDTTLEPLATDRVHVGHSIAHCRQDADNLRLRRQGKVATQDIKRHKGVVVVDERGGAHAEHLRHRHTNGVSGRQRTEAECAHERRLGGRCIGSLQCRRRHQRIIARGEARATEREWWVAKLRSRVHTARHRSAHEGYHQRVELKPKVDGTCICRVSKVHLDIELLTFSHRPCGPSRKHETAARAAR